MTGGSSFVGAPLARRLAADEYDVVAPGRHECDVRDLHAVSKAMADCDSVIHLAYAPVSARPRDIMDTAVNGMANILRACEWRGVRDLMLVSSPWAEDRSYYGVGKLAQETMAGAWLRSGAFQRVIVARVYNAYGPDMGTSHVIPQFIHQMMNLGEQDRYFPVRGSGADVRSFIHVDDCAAQLAALLRHGSPGAAHYDVGTPDEPVTTVSLARAVAACFGQEVTVTPGQPMAVPTVKVPRPPALLTALPRRPFREGLRQTVAWYREHEEELRGQQA